VLADRAGLHIDGQHFLLRGAIQSGTYIPHRGRAEPKSASKRASQAPSREAAARTARRYGAAARGAFVRRFRVRS
jgi:hypothetical protein